MSKYFATMPSHELQTRITDFQQYQTSKKENLYQTRNALLQEVVNNQLQEICLKVITLLPEGNQKKTMQNITHAVQSSAEAFIKNIVDTGSNAEIQQSVDFLNNELLITDNKNIVRVGLKIHDSVYARMDDVFSKVEQGSALEHLQEIEDFFCDFIDLALHHYIGKLAASLNLGFVKRKTVPMIESAMSKGVKLGIKKLFPTVDQEAFAKVIAHYRPMFFEA